MRLGNSRASRGVCARRLALCLATLAGVCAYAHAQATVDLGVTLYDDLGFEWDIRPYGYVSDGTDDAYDGGHRLSIDGVSFPAFSTATTELDGYQFVIGPATFGDIEVARKVFISPDGAFARWIEILTSTSDVGQTVNVEIYTNLGSDDEAFTDTSSGDTFFTEDDVWIVTDDTALGGTGDDPAVVHVLSGAGSALPVTSVYGGQGEGEVGFVYVPPLGQAAVMHYGAQRWYGDEGVDIAIALSELTTVQGLEGITVDEAALIQNFYVGTDPFIAIVNPREGYILGAGAADSAIGAELSVFLANQPGGTHWRWRMVEVDGSFPATGDAGGTVPGDPDSDTFVVAEVGSAYAIEAALVNDDGTMYEPLTTDTVSFDVSIPGEITASPASLSFGEVSRFTGDYQELALDVTAGTAVGILSITSDTEAFAVLSAPERVAAGTPETIVVEFMPTQDGAVAGNILVTHDGVDSPLSIPVSGSGTSEVELTAYVYDSLGFEWQIQGDGGIDDGTNDAYDGAHELDIDGESFPWFSFGTADGREVTIGPATLGVVEVTRQVYVPTDNAFARYLDVIENTTDATQTVTVGMHTNLGSDSSTEVIATSSGDAITDASDHWVVTDDSIDGHGGSDPVVVHVVSGPGGAIVADALTVVAGDDYVSYSYILTLEVGEKVALLQFAVQRHTPDDAIAAAEELSALLGGATDGLSEDDLALVQNFDPDAVAQVDGVEVHFVGGWTLFSLPAPSPQGTLAALAAYDVDTINAWDAETQGYEIVTDGSLEHVSKGYFVHRDAALGGVDATLEVDIEASEAASVDLTIEAGWNLVGVADGGLTLGDVTSYPNTVFGRDGTSYSPANQLRPYEGYWVYNPGDAYDVTLTQLRYRVNTPAAPAVRSAPEPSWVTSLVATGRDGGTATVSVGSGEKASAGYDRMDIAVPPSPGAAERVSVYAVEDGSAGRLSRSIAPTTANEAVWPLRASLPSSGTLAWRGFDLPQGESLRLRANGREYDLTRAGSVDLRVGVADMTVRFARVAPSTTRLLANYPNPFNPETWIPFELKEPSSVDVRIYGVGGALVRRLDLGHRESGYYTARADAAYWDGRNAVGEQVASGVYVYELRAGGERQVRRLLVLK
jgi:hypothetical protein